MICWRTVEKDHILFSFFQILYCFFAVFCLMCFFFSAFFFPKQQKSRRKNWPVIFLVSHQNRSLTDLIFMYLIDKGGLNLTTFWLDKDFTVLALLQSWLFGTSCKKYGHICLPSKICGSPPICRGCRCIWGWDNGRWQVVRSKACLICHNPSVLMFVFCCSHDGLSL